MRAHVGISIASALLASSAASAQTPCVGGTAAGFPCQGVDLLAHLPLNQIGGGDGNDCWGWTDPQTGVEYALMGRSNGTSFIDLSDPVNPVYLGNLPTETVDSPWRDIKTYGTFAFIVSEASGHGMQIFDLTELRSVTNPPVTFTATQVYAGFSGARNVFVNEETGYAYAVGSQTCSGGLHMVDVQDPLNPTFAGCFSSDGYTFHAQVVVYHGPDPDYQGREIAICGNEDTITIVDVTNKANPIQVSRNGYAGSEYVHHAWLTEDHRYVVQGDQLDEVIDGTNTRTYIWDALDLDAPSQIGSFTATTAAIDNNQFVRGDYTYQSNFSAGFRVLSVADIASGTLTEEGFFDTFPANDNASFSGAWGNYPYYASGIAVVSTTESGLFVLDPNTLVDVGDPVAVASPVRLRGALPNPFASVTTIAYDLSEAAAARLTVYDVGGRLVRVLADGPHATGAHAVTWDGSDRRGREVPAGTYFYQLDVAGTRETRRLVRAR